MSFHVYSSVNVFILLLLLESYAGKPMRHNNNIEVGICEGQGGKRYYLEPENTIVVHGENSKVAPLNNAELRMETSTTPKSIPVENSTIVPVSSSNASERILKKRSSDFEMARFFFKKKTTNLHDDKKAVKLHNNKTVCGLEVFTCDGCHLILQVKKLNLDGLCSNEKACRCNYLKIHESKSIPLKPRTICKAKDVGTNHTTLTNELTVFFYFNQSLKDAFQLTVIAKRNTYYIENTANKTTGFISTPFYPHPYPMGYSAEYVIKAYLPVFQIRIIFLDFHISPWSSIEVEDTNRSRVAFFNGYSFRPPILTSSGDVITIRFSASGETELGFRMKYEFIEKSSPIDFPPKTDCGGYVTNFGGVIAMVNMTAPAERNVVEYDCIWIIQSPHEYEYKSHISLTVFQFENMVFGAELEVRQGISSLGYLLQRISQGETFHTVSQEHIVAAETGLYVRLKAAFTRSSRLAIVYSSFSYVGTCFALTDFLCENRRCIPKKLRCDGFDHCGDASDEPSSCYVSVNGIGGEVYGEREWSSGIHSNYYFPSKHSIFDPLSSSGILMLFGIVCIFVFLFGLISFLFRQVVQDRQHRSANRDQNYLQFNEGIEVYDAAADDPPVYESPPEYDEVLVKIFSGNKLKLVRRPGGSTIWVRGDECKGVEKNSQQSSSTEELGPSGKDILFPHKPLSRHTSLDGKDENGVILWESNQGLPMRAKAKNKCKGNKKKRPREGTNSKEITYIMRSSLPNIRFLIGQEKQDSNSISADATQGSCENLNTDTEMKKTEVPIENSSLKFTSENISSTHWADQKEKAKKDKNGSLRKPRLIRREGGRLLSKEQVMKIHKNCSSLENLVSTTPISNENTPLRRNIPLRHSSLLRIKAARDRFQKLSNKDTLAEKITRTKNGSYEKAIPAGNIEQKRKIFMKYMQYSSVTGTDDKLCQSNNPTCNGSSCDYHEEPSKNEDIQLRVSFENSAAVSQSSSQSSFDSFYDSRNHVKEEMTLEGSNHIEQRIEKISPLKEEQENLKENLYAKHNCLHAYADKIYFNAETDENLQNLKKTHTTSTLEDIHCLKSINSEDKFIEQISTAYKEIDFKNMDNPPQSIKRSPECILADETGIFPATVSSNCEAGKSLDEHFKENLQTTGAIPKKKTSNLLSSKPLIRKTKGKKISTNSGINSMRNFESKEYEINDETQDIKDYFWFIDNGENIEKVYNI